MNHGILAGLIACGLTMMVRPEYEIRPSADYTLHEWGTFTTMAGSDGVLLSGLHVEEEELPGFVHELQPGGHASIKGMEFPPSFVTVKMETPVIYFYADHGFPVTVDVGFKGGSITQWYPQRTRGEPMLPNSVLNFSQPYNGHIRWEAEVLPPGTKHQPSADSSHVTHTWAAPRKTDSNLVRGDSGEIEKYLFYRGLGRFGVPLRTRYNIEEQLTLTNDGADDIPYAFLYEKDRSGRARIAWSGNIPAGSTTIVIDDGHDQTAGNFVEFQKALVGAGLFEKEARGMIETWRESYFEKPGLRLFWIVPRTFTDDILPLDVSPAPRNIERVMVGRSEILSPEFERQLLEDFAQEKNPWQQDRFFPAYAERVEALRPKS